MEKGGFRLKIPWKIMEKGGFRLKNVGKVMEVTYDLRMRKWCSERIVIFDGFKMIQPENVG